MYKYLFFALGAITLLIACKKGMTLQATDLNKYGAPFSIMAPKNVVVTATNLGGAMDDITLVKDRFDVQIIGGTKTAADAKTLKAEKIAELKTTSPTFKMLKEEEDGFVYEMQIDTTVYNFFYAKIVGDKQFSFQTGFTATATQAEATEMYEAVRSK
jgi:hypothetical protein